MDTRNTVLGKTVVRAPLDTLARLLARTTELQTLIYRIFRDIHSVAIDTNIYHIIYLQRPYHFFSVSMERKTRFSGNTI